MAGLTVNTAPTTEPVTLQEVKEYLRVDDSTDERIIRPFTETTGLLGKTIYRNC